MPYDILEKQFDLLSAERQKSVYSFISYLLTEQEKENRSPSASVSEKLSLLNSISGIVPKDIDLDSEHLERIQGK